MIWLSFAEMESKKKTIAAAVTPSEYRIISRAARKAKMRKSKWIRTVVLEAAAAIEKKGTK